jgi:hypothetical protein
MSCRGPLTCFAVLIFLSTIASGFAAERKFEPGELLIGYATSSDRDRGIKKLTGTKDTLRVRGDRLEGVDAQPIASNAVKLRLTFPTRVLSATRDNPSAEIADLQELARQLKEMDPSVQYAHPNWIADVRVQPSSGVKEASHRSHRRAHKPSRAATIMAREHHHRGGGQPQWWGFDLRWTFSFSPSCWDQTSRRPKGHHTHRECLRDAMR